MLSVSGDSREVENVVCSVESNRYGRPANDTGPHLIQDRGRTVVAKVLHDLHYEAPLRSRGCALHLLSELTGDGPWHDCCAMLAACSTDHAAVVAVRRERTGTDQHLWVSKAGAQPQEPLEPGEERRVVERPLRCRLRVPAAVKKHIDDRRTDSYDLANDVVLSPANAALPKGCSAPREFLRAGCGECAHHWLMGRLLVIAIQFRCTCAPQGMHCHIDCCETQCSNLELNTQHSGRGRKRHRSDCLEARLEVGGPVRRHQQQFECRDRHGHAPPDLHHGKPRLVWLPVQCSGCEGFGPAAELWRTVLAEHRRLEEHWDRRSAAHAA